MANSQLHVALSLLELSTLIGQGRAFLSTFRFQSLDSSSAQALAGYRQQVLALFGGLPALDLGEEQAFFVAAVAAPDGDALSGVLSPSVEIRVDQIKRLYPVSESGREIFLTTRRLPGVVLGDSSFSRFWDEFFWNRHAHVALRTAVDFADRFVEASLPAPGTLSWKQMATVAIRNDSKLAGNDGDAYVAVVQRVLRYRRSVEERGRYDDTSAPSVLVDLFKCVFIRGDTSEVAARCRQFCAEMLKRPAISLPSVAQDSQELFKELGVLLGCQVSDLTGLLIFLAIRLQKQNGLVRSLDDIAPYAMTQPGFDAQSIANALLLVGLSEEQEALINFIHGDRKETYGLFGGGSRPAAQVSSRLLEGYFLSRRYPDGPANAGHLKVELQKPEAVVPADASQAKVTVSSTEIVELQQCATESNGNEAIGRDGGSSEAVASSPERPPAGDALPETKEGGSPASQGAGGADGSTSTAADREGGAAQLASGSAMATLTQPDSDAPTAVIGVAASASNEQADDVADVVIPEASPSAGFRTLDAPGDTPQTAHPAPEKSSEVLPVAQSGKDLLGDQEPAVRPSRRSGGRSSTKGTGKRHRAGS